MDNGVQVHWKHFSGETLSCHSWVSSYVRPLGSSQTFGKFLLSHFPTFWRSYGCSRTLLPFLGSLCPLPWTSGIFLLLLHIAWHSLFILPRATIKNGSGFLHLRTSQALSAPRPLESVMDFPLYRASRAQAETFCMCSSPAHLTLPNSYKKCWRSNNDIYGALTLGQTLGWARG